MTSTPIRLLLLEDNDSDALLEQTALSEYAPGEFVTTRVTRLSQALKRLDAEPFDIVLSDLGLPDSVGLNAVQSLTAHAPEIPLVVMTGARDDELGRAAILQGAQDFLIKGETNAALVARTLRHAIERKRLEISLREANETLESRVADRTATLETALRSVKESAQRYRALTQSANDAIVTIDSGGVIVNWNRGAENIFGYADQEIIGFQVTILLPERYHDRHKAGMQRTLCGGEHHVIGKTMEGEGLRKDGTEFSLELSLSTWELAGSVYFTALIRDISERKRMEAAAEQERLRLQTILRTASDGIHILDRDGLLVEANDAFLNMLGYDHSIIGRGRVTDWDAHDPWPVIKQRNDDLIKRQGKAIFETRHCRRDGVVIDVEISSSGIDIAGKGYLYCASRDISERRAAHAEHRLAADVFDQSAEGIVITGADRGIVMVNRAFAAIAGYSREEVIGKNPRILTSGREGPEFYRSMWESIDRTGHWEGELWNRRKDGTEYPVWLSIGRVVDDEGRLTHYIGTFTDITQRKASEEHIQWLAHFDALTGLPNRGLAADRARHSLAAVQRNNEPLALMFLDLDHFKNVNDSLGHHVGDALLAAFAKRLTHVLRGQDTVSRLGGDEFVLVLPGTDAAAAAHVAEELIQAVSQPYQIEHHELRVTTSIGVAMYPNDATDFESLSKCADVAVHRAKADGRNNCRFFTSEMQARSARRVLLENELHCAVERHELTLHYQPQFSMRSGAIVGAEALLRWRHPVLGMVSPAEFIPVAESSGQILPIGEWVLRSAVRQWAYWFKQGMAPMTIAVNLSAVQFRHPRLPDLVTQILDEEKMAPRYLELELTEGVAMDDPLGAIAIMDGLHRRGVRMSIDDFGTGYSSLNYLKRFKVYKLKIDQSFVSDITDDPEDKAIVGAIISLAKNLGLQTIAEGVETAGQAAFLLDNGCHEVQGYFYSKPLSVDRFEAFVRGRIGDA